MSTTTREQRQREYIAREIACAAGFRPDDEPLEEQYEAAERVITKLRRDFARGEIVVGYSLELLTLAMQAAWIEWKHGRGATKAMEWIENVLDGPDLIPDVSAGESAQAYYDAKRELIEAWRKDADARLAPTRSEP